MSATDLASAMRRLRRVAARRAGASLSDAELVRRFVATRDEAAFEVLVWRHGGGLLRLCRQLLRTAQDAEDAFQATFLIFVRKAACIGKRESVGSWLYKVAYRAALRLRALRARQAPTHADLELAGHAAGNDQSDLPPILHEEVQRLPERYRVPVVLCYLEGKTTRDVAEQLGRSQWTIGTQLARGKEMLRKRLVRRGVSLSAGAVGVVLSRFAQEAASAATHVPLVVQTVDVAMQFAINPASVVGASARAAALARGVLRVMFMNHLRVMAIGMLAVVGVAAGAVLLAGVSLSAGPQGEGVGGRQTPLGGIPVPDQRANDDLEALQGVWRIKSYQHKGTSTRAEELQPLRVVIKKNRLRLEANGQLVVEATLKIDPSKNPKTLEVDYIDPKGKRSIDRGIYRLEKDQWTCCYVVDSTDRPKEFKVGPELEAHLGVYEREKPGDSGGASAAPPKDWRIKATIELGGKASAYSLALSPDGKVIAVGSEGKIQLWAAEGGQQLAELEHQGTVWSLAFTPDGRTLASGSKAGTVMLWDVPSRLLKASMEGHADNVNSVAFSADGKLLATGSFDKTVRLWDADTGKQLRQIAVGAGEVTGVAFSPDGGTIAVATGLGKVVKLWELDTGKEVRTFAGHTDLVWCVAFSPDGRTLASGGRDTTVRLWEPATGKERAVLKWHVGQVNAVAFSPDGKTLASAGGTNDHTVQLWDAVTGKEITTLKEHTETVWCVRFAGNPPIL